ncbi:hypothetical protein QUB70_16735 [Microcoleus sp. A003_D6]|uniref:hypothetical protein n=1 Tax=Microcoleus sp. A003_D6 TaxID=3055266 RepID=UPI002FD5B8EE
MPVLIIFARGLLIAAGVFAALRSFGALATIFGGWPIELAVRIRSPHLLKRSVSGVVTLKLQQSHLSLHRKR